MSYQRAAVVAGYYLTKAGLPLDVILLIFSHCDTDRVLRTTDCGFGWPLFIMFDNDCLLRSSTHWDLLSLNTLSRGYRFELPANGSFVTADMLSKACHKQQGSWFCFTFRRNGTCRPSHFVDKIPNYMDVISEVFTCFFSFLL